MKKDIIIGSHVSFKKDDQLKGCVQETIKYGANAFMFYTGAPQNTMRAPINDELTLEAMNLMKENNIDLENVVVHAPYIINPANTKNLDFSINFLNQELDRVAQLGVNKIVLHPGSHVGLGVDVGIDNIAFVLNNCLSKEKPVTICLETMAGKGSEIGSNFEELKSIIDKVNLKEKIKICLDTCHLNDAGYDVENFDILLEEFDKIIGIDKIGCVHLNDSKNIISSKKDRHENIGFGTIGYEALLKIAYNEKLKNIPKILETPYVSLEDNKKISFPPYRYEIEMIRNKKFNNNLKENIINYYK